MRAALQNRPPRRPRKPAPPAACDLGPVVIPFPGPERCGRAVARPEAPAFPDRGRPVLDLSQVERMDANSLLAVLRAAKRVRESGRVLRIGCPAPAVRMLLASVGLPELAEVHPTADQALAAARVG